MDALIDLRDTQASVSLGDAVGPGSPNASSGATSPSASAAGSGSLVESVSVVDADASVEGAAGAAAEVVSVLDGVDVVDNDAFSFDAEFESELHPPSAISTSKAPNTPPMVAR